MHDNNVMKSLWHCLAGVLAFCTLTCAAPVNHHFFEFWRVAGFQPRLWTQRRPGPGRKVCCTQPEPARVEYGLESITFAGSISDTNANPVTVSIYDNAGAIPGQSLIDLSATIGETAAEFTVSSPDHIAFTPGQTYWVVLSNPFQFDVVWNADGR